MKRLKKVASQSSYGYAVQTCPGAQVALHETRVFIDDLLREPGLKLESTPRLQWNKTLMSYEVRDTWLSCTAG